MGRTLSRFAGVVFAGALAIFAAAPAALAQTETSTSPTETTTSTSETSTSETSTTSSSPTSTTAPSSAAATTPSQRTHGDVKTTEKRVAPPVEPKIKADAAEPAETAAYPDNYGHGFVGAGGEGILVVSCAAGAPGNLATQYLTVTGGPDQDEANGLWNYTVRVVDAPAGTTTAKFSWTCGGVEGNGTVEFEQKQQPPTSTVTVTATAPGTTTSTATSTPSSSAPASSTAPTTTATSSTPAGNAAPKAQVKVAPKGGVETGFGGTAW
ncbi:hypothetical protein PV458_22365 [Streptomyces sp. MN03-5084-2B]|nr:hypothetical protein [Streptomyces sp. MN03-5084-2B]